jgi:hypothetical protein
MVRGVQSCQWASGSKRLANGQMKNRPKQRKEGENQEDTPKGKYGGGRSIHDWQQVKSQF